MKDEPLDGFWNALPLLHGDQLKVAVFIAFIIVAALLVIRLSATGSQRIAGDRTKRLDALAEWQNTVADLRAEIATLKAEAKQDREDNKKQVDGVVKRSDEQAKEAERRSEAQAQTIQRLIFAYEGARGITYRVRDVWKEIPDDLRRLIEALPLTSAIVNPVVEGE